MAEFRELGWPVSILDDRVLLTLGSEASALVLPIGLAEQAQAILAARQCPAAVLVHADAPEWLANRTAQRCPGRRPSGVVTGTLPLPSSTTPQGAVTWHYLPDNRILRMCREIDIFAAVRTVWRDRAPRSD